MIDEILTLMKTHDYFDGLSDDILKDIAQHMELAFFKTGDCVHEAHQPTTDILFVVSGRLKAVVVAYEDFGEKETLFRFFESGEQMGMMSAALVEALPIRAVALEPSLILRLDYQVSLDLTGKYRDLRQLWNTVLAGALTQCIIGGARKKKRYILTIFHESPLTRPLVVQLLRRLCDLKEKLGVLSDYPGCASIEVPFRSLNEGGRYLTEKEVRQQLAKWQHHERVIVDVAAELDVESAGKLMEISDRVLWCVSPEYKEMAVEHLRALEAHAPGWRDKISIVWDLTDSHIAPDMPALRELTRREFSVSSVPKTPSLGLAATNGLERLVHCLRGVQIGLALGGGAARGMAHLGVLKVLEENGIVVDMIAGTSAGAMTGTLYAAGLEPDYLAQKFAQDLTPPWIFRQLKGGGYWYLMYKYRTGGFDPMLRKYIADSKLEQLPIPCSAIAVDLVHGEAVIHDSSDAVHAILSSINLPGLASPICRGGGALIDGGFLNNVPADVLVSKGCNFVIAVDVLAKIPKKVGTIVADSPQEFPKPPSVFQTVMRTYTVQNYNMNALGAAPADISIEPDMSQFHLDAFTRAVEASEIGKAKCIEQLARLKKLLHRLDRNMFSN
ncbi:MAG: patatin-like phospholipase family protein [Gemmataceae bacterium]